MATEVALDTSSIHQTGPQEIELRSNEQTPHGNEAQLEGSSQDTALTHLNILKVLAASLSFFLAGSNDGSLGALTPYILRTYNVGTEYVALMQVLL
jgi:hypothetical protein